jgi:hypothetical protein
MSYSSSIFHSYAIELNYKLFFVYATYFINLLWLWLEKSCFIKSNDWFEKIGVWLNCGWNWGWTKSSLMCLVKNAFEIEVIK